MDSLDQQIRIAAFSWLDQQVRIYGDVLSYKLLQTGFLFEGERIPLVSPQGIFKPKFMNYPLSILTSWQSPYDDSFDNENLINYKYRGTNIHHYDNVGLRNAMKNGTPLIYFHGVMEGKYLAVWPVYVVRDNPELLNFSVAADAIDTLSTELSKVCEPDARKSYLTSIVRVRLHQRCFREKVLIAYKQQCAFCKLKHTELLDAAHIIPDGNPISKPVINNGISLCKLHHAAFDSSFLGINPDYVIEVREDILAESDGPMLQHGLKALHKNKIILPYHKQDWPDKEFLDHRFQMFKRAI